jgi:DNA mismatch repair ATPase MutS
VARLAGVPEPVTRRAASILAELERSRHVASVHNVPDETVANGTANGHIQAAEVGLGLALPTAGETTALRRLAQLDPLRMSPLEALSELAALVGLLDESSQP